MEWIVRRLPHWAPRPQALGHRVRLIVPQYGKPFVRRGKTDRAAAAAITLTVSLDAMEFGTGWD